MQQNSMSYFYQINTTNDKWYKSFWEIYSTSFPVHEQRNFRQQTEAFNNPHYHLYCIIKDDKIYSFIGFWEFGNYVYIEHFAVNSHLRGQNIGSETLKLFAEEIQKTIILEIDPVVDEVSEKRLRFYQKLGFMPNCYKHLHPAYNTAYKPHELLVLSKGKVLTEAEYNNFKNDLEQIVMKES